MTKTGKWKFVTVKDESGDKRALRAQCPGCGAWGELDDHSVDECGQVVPSVDCPECPFHDLLVLIGFPHSPYEGNHADMTWDGDKFNKRDDG